MNSPDRLIGLARTRRSKPSTIHARSRTQAMTLGLREQLRQCRQPRAPTATGVESHRRVDIGVVAVRTRREGHAAQHALALVVIVVRRGFAALAHLAQRRTEQYSQGPGHPGMEARMLRQQR